MTKEKLIEQIMIECEKDDEPVTREEAEEMAEMEIKANGIKRYEKSDKPRKKVTKERKVDETKKRVIQAVRVLLEGMNIDVTNVKNESEISFTIADDDFTFKLIKHRKKKG